MASHFSEYIVDCRYNADESGGSKKGIACYTVLLVLWIKSKLNSPRTLIRPNHRSQFELRMFVLFMGSGGLTSSHASSRNVFSYFAYMASALGARRR